MIAHSVHHTMIVPLGKPQVRIEDMPLPAENAFSRGRRDDHFAKCHLSDCHVSYE